MISLNRLAEAYQHFGFAQVLHDPFVFKSANGQISFHDQTPDGLLDVDLVIEDIARWNPCLAEKMREYLGQPHDDVA